jgi:hypothetical protein
MVSPTLHLYRRSLVQFKLETCWQGVVKFSVGSKFSALVGSRVGEMAFQVPLALDLTECQGGHTRSRYAHL